MIGRALHYVFKIGDRKRNSFFFRDILGMKVLRHEEFTEGCDAQCNGAYNNRWSKTMVGFGPESSHFVIELTYNYGVQSYKCGNDFDGITIISKEIIERARQNNYPIENVDNIYILTAPDGYKFYILNDSQPIDSDPIVKVSINCTNIADSLEYWNNILGMKICANEEKKVVLHYDNKQIKLQLTKIEQQIDRATAFGRIAFAISLNDQLKINEIIKAKGKTIMIPLVTLETPGKAAVRVIILKDPDNHEICFVDEEGFTQLSQVDPEGEKLFEKYMKIDPFQTS